MVGFWGRTVTFSVLFAWGSGGVQVSVYPGRLDVLRRITRIRYIACRVTLGACTVCIVILLWERTTRI